MQPSLSECFGLARTLRARGRRDCPTVVLHTFGGDDALGCRTTASAPTGAWPSANWAMPPTAGSPS
jgi:hypothetical protein